ncbi:hypothetical protein FB451DRAFT_1176697 [Mycena latifolia]|nr:hypothetical protein FB451DRAFT_1176697 [Mycena latifolia]
MHRISRCDSDEPRPTALFSAQPKRCWRVQVLAGASECERSRRLRTDEQFNRNEGFVLGKADADHKRGEHQVRRRTERASRRTASGSLGTASRVVRETQEKQHPEHPGPVGPGESAFRAAREERSGDDQATTKMREVGDQAGDHLLLPITIKPGQLRDWDREAIQLGRSSDFLLALRLPAARHEALSRTIVTSGLDIWRQGTPLPGFVQRRDRRAALGLHYTTSVVRTFLLHQGPAAVVNSTVEPTRAEVNASWFISLRSWLHITDLATISNAVGDFYSECACMCDLNHSMSRRAADPAADVPLPGLSYAYADLTDERLFAILKWRAPSVHLAEMG